jgi:hypothetical protein
MDNKIYYYIFFFLILIFICIKFVYPHIDDKKEGFKEGAVNIGKEIKKAFTSSLKSAMKPVTKRFNMMGKGLRDIFTGIGKEFQYLGIGLGRGVSDIGLLFAYVSQYLFSYLMCGVKYVSNIPNCILYYMVDSVIQIVYLPIRITLWFLATFLRINLYGTQRSIWKVVEWVNGKVYAAAGFNIIRWPKNVRDQCYNCKRLKQSVLMKKAKEIDYDFKKNIPKIMNKGAKQIAKGGKTFMGAFK